MVVIGAGIRNPPPSLGLFETVLNAAHRGAPGARIAFNTRPDDSDVAAVRSVGEELRPPRPKTAVHIRFKAFQRPLCSMIPSESLNAECLFLYLNV